MGLYQSPCITQHFCYHPPSPIPSEPSSGFYKALLSHYCCTWMFFWGIVTRFFPWRVSVWTWSPADLLQRNAAVSPYVRNLAHFRIIIAIISSYGGTCWTYCSQCINGASCFLSISILSPYCRLLKWLRMPLLLCVFSVHSENGYWNNCILAGKLTSYISGRFSV